MNKRSELGEKLLKIVENVYFQPPESVKLVYPCIVYRLDSSNITYANDRKYINKRKYNVVVVDKNPDSKLPDGVEGLDYSNLRQFYTRDNLNHWVFDVYY